MSLRRCECAEFDGGNPSDRPPNNRELLKHYINHGPIQPLEGFTRNGEGRSFRAEWYSRFHWLEYSRFNQSAFCFYCRFLPTKARQLFVEGIPMEPLFQKVS